VRRQRGDQGIGAFEHLAGVAPGHQRPHIGLRRRHREAAPLQALERTQPGDGHPHGPGQRRADADHGAGLVQRAQRLPQRGRVATVAPVQRHRGGGLGAQCGLLAGKG
jgi:hypothetical protein